MTDLTFVPAELAELSVAQLAALSPQQKIVLARQLEQAGDWLKQVKARFDAALEHTYGDRIRSARSDGGKDFGVVHVADGDLRLTVDVSKRVTWDQAQLATIAKRIDAAGESVEEFIDVSYSISESRFQNWPSTLRSQFEAARTVKPGKTIEAALIARELLDRGEIQRMAVLCPPHLVEQWVRELNERFHIPAMAVTASSAARLERGLPIGDSIFHAHAFTVVSLDYIKSDRHRHDFIRACPEFVIVDEAHTCVSTGQARQQRFELLRELAADAERHLVLLTATPHSGNQDAFYSLLALLKPVFAQLATASGDNKDIDLCSGR